jgi:transmembrane sensor
VSDLVSAHEPGPDVLAEAAEWFVLLASGEASEADRARWRAWRAADLRHEAGWRRTEAATALFGRIPEPHQQASAEALNRRPALSRGRRRALGGIAGLFIAGFLGREGWLSSDLSADARTAVGERRDIVLADGSRLQMDTDTALDIEFSARARLIRLRRGRVLIATAHGLQAAAPFFVQTAEGRVQALGTRFTVWQREGLTEVTVLEARVALHAEAARGEPPVLSAGQHARFDRRGVIDRRTTQVGDSAWTRGMLIADAMPLDAFVAELARYRSTPLALAPGLRALRISGTYPLADTDRALAALCATLPVRLQALRSGDPASGQILVAAD